MKPTLGIFLILVGLGVKWLLPTTVFGSGMTRAAIALVFIALGLSVMVVRKPEEWIAHEQPLESAVTNWVADPMRLSCVQPLVKSAGEACIWIT